MKYIRAEQVESATKPSQHASKAAALMASLVVLVLAACGGGTSSSTTPPTGGPASVERNVAPTAADPRVDIATESNVVINPSPDVTATNRLFVFLPGTEGLPDMYRLIVRAGASRGFHAIGLNYPNDEAVGRMCAFSTDSNCYWDVRREVVTGVDASTLVEVNVANSIATRLAKTIEYMASRYPDEGWGQYLAGSSVNWSMVIVSGHSQGGGHAGVMTKLYSLNRAVYFSSPADWSSMFNAPASWLSRSNVTPASRQFGLTHLEDPLVPHDQLSVIWRTLGLEAFGAEVLVDSNVPPYAGSHVLTTDLEPNTSQPSVSPEHGATVLDNATPRASDGSPLLTDAWNYLAFAR